MRKFFTFVLVAAAPFVNADDVVVPNTFSADTVISSSQMNANFDALVQESNENDARLASTEAEVAALAASVQGVTYTWLGYTTNVFPQDSETNFGSLLTWNNFCKTEFSDNAAQIATTEIFAAISAQNMLPLPPTNAAVMPIWNARGDSLGFIKEWSLTGSISETICILLPNGRLLCTANMDTSLIATCVTQN